MTHFNKQPDNSSCSLLTMVSNLDDKLMPNLEVALPNEEASLTFSALVAAAMQKLITPEMGFLGYLEGDLGAGKSYFVRGFIQTFAPETKVKSPTYTLVESYPLSIERQAVTVYHLDLYRLCDPEEFEFLGGRDLFQSPSIAWVEWPQKAEGFLPQSDVVFALKNHTFGELVGRKVICTATSEQGITLLQHILTHHQRFLK